MLRFHCKIFNGIFCQKAFYHVGSDVIYVVSSVHHRKFAWFDGNGEGDEGCGSIWILWQYYSVVRVVWKFWAHFDDSTAYFHKVLKIFCMTATKVLHVMVVACCIEYDNLKTYFYLSLNFHFFCFCNERAFIIPSVWCGTLRYNTPLISSIPQYKHLVRVVYA